MQNYFCVKYLLLSVKGYCYNYSSGKIKEINIKIFGKRRVMCYKKIWLWKKTEKTVLKLREWLRLIQKESRESRGRTVFKK